MDFSILRIPFKPEYWEPECLAQVYPFAGALIPFGFYYQKEHGEPAPKNLTSYVMHSDHIVTFQRVSGGKDVIVIVDPVHDDDGFVQGVTVRISVCGTLYQYLENANLINDTVALNEGLLRRIHYLCNRHKSTRQTKCKALARVTKK